ncbi:tyrosine-type recombinase/integrase [Cupriavidus sp. SW-Y-13]|uniref:tyrosine-type recombinase/integrase n=1 Tax=Cupriavidus sp. SW-Y-13 TaxID=2653854 RepID=UPI00139C2130|nr:tyrosine-type recombinase/integrase [Cupriavidus sp. SW-Y-13]
MHLRLLRNGTTLLALRITHTLRPCPCEDGFLFPGAIMGAQAEPSICPFPPYLEDLRALCHPDPSSPALHEETLRSTAYTEVTTILRWLSSAFAPATKRAYEKEVHRFCCWALFVARKPLRAMTRGDLEAYETFLLDPPGSWCAIRNRRRNDGAWRPFEGALSEKSRTFAFGVLENLFSFLVDAKIVVQNPVRELRRLRKAITSGRKKPSASLPWKSFDLLVEQLKAECLRVRAGSRQHLEAERMLFVILFMASTGIRAEELVCVRLSDLCCLPPTSYRDESWSLFIGSAKERLESISLNRTAVYAIWRYLTARGIPFPPACSSVPLLSRLGSNQQSIPLTRDAVYYLFKKALSRVADNIEREYPEDASRFRKATPHWLRVTYCRNAADTGHSLPTIQRQVRHRSIVTTADNVQIQNVWRLLRD